MNRIDYIIGAIVAIIIAAVIIYTIDCSVRSSEISVWEYGRIMQDAEQSPVYRRAVQEAMRDGKITVDERERILKPAYAEIQKRRSLPWWQQSHDR